MKMRYGFLVLYNGKAVKGGVERGGKIGPVLRKWWKRVRSGERWRGTVERMCTKKFC